MNCYICARSTDGGGAEIYICARSITWRSYEDKSTVTEVDMNIISKINHLAS